MALWCFQYNITKYYGCTIYKYENFLPIQESTECHCDTLDHHCFIIYVYMDITMVSYVRMAPAYQTSFILSISLNRSPSGITDLLWAILAIPKMARTQLFYVKLTLYLWLVSDIYVIKLWLIYDFLLYYISSYQSFIEIIYYVHSVSKRRSNAF